MKRPARDAVVENSDFSRVPVGAREALVAAGTQIRLASKAYFVHSGDAPRCGLVVKGMVRTVRTTADGRDLTLHWERPGGIVGLTAAVRGPAPTSVQAVTDSVLVELPVPLIRDLARADGDLGWAIAEHATARLREPGVARAWLQAIDIEPRLSLAHARMRERHIDRHAQWIRDARARRAGRASVIKERATARAIIALFK